MRSRVLTALLATAAIAALLPAAGEASSASLKVRKCETGDRPHERLATFYGHMRRVRRTRRMMMRFTLIVRSSDGASFVPAPRKLSRWRKSRRGVKRYGYSQTITGLKSGGAYAAVVEFRWIGAHKRTIRSARRTSAVCRQDGALPNLTVTDIRARPGDAPRTELYSIDVTNRGRGEARDLRVHLAVDRATADAAKIDALAPGETKTVEVSGPVCKARVRAVVDRRDAIPETTEDDNSLRRRCPVVAR
jgi:hypothetical protein